MNINRERYVKPKYDKYIQLYSKKAKVEDGEQTISILNTIDIDNQGQQYPSNQTATISAPASGTTPQVELTILNGKITNAVLSNFASSVYTKPPTITLTSLPITSTSVKSIEIINEGTGYSTAPLLYFSFPPTARKARLSGVINDSGVLTSVSIIDGGLGYLTAPTIVVKGITQSPLDILASVVAVVSNGVITSVSINYAATGGGSYDARQAIISVSDPDTTDIAKATCTIDTDGNINSVTITRQGLNYTSNPTIFVEGDGGAVLYAYLKQGFGANLSLNYQYNPTSSFKFYWELDTPLEINENAVINLVHREFYNVPTNDKGKLIVIRMHDITTKSIVNTKNIGINPDFNSGIIVDIGKEDRLLPNEINIEINPQTIDRITMSLNHDISGFSGFHYGIEFLLILRVIEREPNIIEYGTLNNLTLNNML